MSVLFLVSALCVVAAVVPRFLHSMLRAAPARRP
jgi:hypothetical protein